MVEVSVDLKQCSRLVVLYSSVTQQRTGCGVKLSSCSGTLDDDEIKIAMLTLGFLDVNDEEVFLLCSEV